MATILLALLDIRSALCPSLPSLEPPDALTDDYLLDLVALLSFDYVPPQKNSKNAR